MLASSLLKPALCKGGVLIPQNLQRHEKPHDLKTEVGNNACELCNTCKEVGSEGQDTEDEAAGELTWKP